MIWLQLLYVYLKIGILGFGGGYAMLYKPTWWTAMVGFPCRSLPILSLSLK